MYEKNLQKTAVIRKRDGLRKVAILLVAIGEEAASVILKNMNQKEVETITREISSLRNVPAGKIKDVIYEYYKMWQAKKQISEGGINYAEQILQMAMGEKQANSILKKLGFMEKEHESGFDKLEEVNDDQLVSFLIKEHPQTNAVILSRLDNKKAATILEKFPEELQLDISHRIAILEEVSPDFIVGVESYLETLFKNELDKTPYELEGQKVVANILNMVDKSAEKKILSGLSDIDKTLATDIKNLMFVFDDLVLIDDRSIQKILKEIDSKVLSIALKGAEEVTKEKIFSNMSQRAASLLQEEIEYIGPVLLKEVEEAQRKILSVVSNLEERGEIVIYKEGSDNAVIV